MMLEDGSRVGIIGGGPSGSLTAYFILTFAGRAGLNLSVDIYEHRDFNQPGPGSCNMCGGIVSEPLVQTLAVEGINLPEAVVQRGIDSYVLHTKRTSVRIDTPLHEKRIAALHRGGGPKGFRELQFGGLDGYLLGLAEQLGANVIKQRVREVAWRDGLPCVVQGESAQPYELLVGATGVNSGSWQLFEKLGFKAKPPKTSKTFITEIHLGAEGTTQHFGSSVHIYFDNIPGLDLAAIIPKGEFVTVCLLGKAIDQELIGTFFASPAVRRCFPDDWEAGAGSCRCLPNICVREAKQLYMDRVVLVGDCGATRLYKDGIGAAYRTAKSVAATAVFSGVSAEEFHRHYRPVYRKITRDNRYGSVIFLTVHVIKKLGPLARGVLRMTAKEQSRAGSAKRMSVVMWDMFTGSAPYREVFFKTLDPRFWARFMWESAVAIFRRRPIRQAQGRPVFDPDSIGTQTRREALEGRPIAVKETSDEQGQAGQGVR